MRILRLVTPLAAAIFFVKSSHADPCAALPGAAIYIENGDTQENLLKKLGSSLVRSGAFLRIIYQNQPTCTLASDFYNPVTHHIVSTGARPVRYIPTAAEDPTWEPSKLAPTCEVVDGDAATIQLAIGATYLSSCAGLTPRADVRVFTGPAQSYGFVVPTGSSQIALTAEEGFFAFGYANDTGQAEPWTDQNLRFIRASTASTALTSSAAINLKASALKGTIAGGNTSGELLAAVIASPTPEKTIGILGTEVFDANRAVAKILAFRGFNQRFAYFPDKTSTSFDKQNVRDGHYLPWAPTPYLAYAPGGLIADASAKRVVDLIVNLKDEADVSGIDPIISSGLVPECAMKVQRAFDGGELSTFAPAEPCGCYFEAKVPQGSTKCVTCTNDSTCGTGACRRGYCEAR